MITPNNGGAAAGGGLAEVLALLAKATPGPWLDHGLHDDGEEGERIIAQHRTEAMGYAVARCLPCGIPDSKPALTAANAQAIAAAVNYLRSHGEAIRELVEADKEYDEARSALESTPLVGFGYRHLQENLDRASVRRAAALSTNEGGR